MVDGRSLRADARRNRARVLHVAAQVFATEGHAVSVAEIARRAGVGTGTVSRHFPTKEHLVEAVLRDRVEGLVAEADRLAEHEEPGTAFFAFFTSTVRAGAADRGLTERLAAAGDQTAAGRRLSVDVLCDRLGGLLVSAQDAGAVRGDVILADVEALMAACMTREPLDPIVAVVREGLRTTFGRGVPPAR